MTGKLLRDKLLDLMRQDARLTALSSPARRVRALEQARTFAFSDAAVERVERAGSQYPEQLVTNQQFAIPAFPNMWIEAGCVGYWLRPDGKVEVYRAVDDGTVYVPPVWFLLNTPPSREAKATMASLVDPVRHSVAEILLGSEMCGYLGHRLRQRFTEAHTLCVSSYDDWTRARGTVSAYHPVRHLSLDEYKRQIAGHLDLVKGCVATLVAYLLAMNQPSHVISFSETPRRRGLVGNKPTVFAGYTTVDILLDKPRLLLRKPPSTGHHRSPRWHEVRGHFVHRGGEPGCAHDWEPLPPVDDADTRRRWVCTSCERKRTWRECPEGRGSAQVGYVRQDRRVRVWGEDGDK